MLPARRTDRGRDVGRNAMGAVTRRPAAIAQAETTALVEARNPFVAGLATDAVTRTQLRHRIQLQAVIVDESLSLVHG